MMNTSYSILTSDKFQFSKSDIENSYITKNAKIILKDIVAEYPRLLYAIRIFLTNEDYIKHARKSSSKYFRIDTTGSALIYAMFQFYYFTSTVYKNRDTGAEYSPNYIQFKDDMFSIDDAIKKNMYKLNSQERLYIFKEIDKFNGGVDYKIKNNKTEKCISPIIIYPKLDSRSPYHGQYRIDVSKILFFNVNETSIGKWKSFKNIFKKNI